MKLTVIVQTRGRPHTVIPTVEKTLASCGRDDTRIMVQIDDDDELTLDAIDKFPKDGRVMLSIKPREDSRGEKYDRALTDCPADIYLLGVDFVPILTPAFDQVIINAARIYPDGIGCVYTPMCNASFPGLQAITAKMVEKIGYTYNHEYPFWFIDHELDDIARMIGRFTFVNIEANYTGMRQPKTHRLRDLKFWACYFDAMTIERRRKARAIIDDPEFESPEWMKEVLRNSYQLVEARSMHINAQVREASEQIEAMRGDTSPPDLGYLRLKKAAEQKLDRKSVV